MKLEGRKVFYYAAGFENVIVPLLTKFDNSFMLKLPGQGRKL
jgi:hypothetical protein